MYIETARIPRPGTLEPPVNFGITGDICYRCNQNAFDACSKGHPADQPATSNLYDLTCHTLGVDPDVCAIEEFLCANCITIEWAISLKDFIPCPWCRRDAGFKRLEPLENTNVSGMIRGELSSSETIRTQDGVAATLVGITREEGWILTTELYVVYCAQVGGEEALGGPVYQTSFGFNRFLHALLKEFHGESANRRFVVTPEV
ncbi:hypothetical protein PMIN06_005642 [Paraphaeosphaeria minitans]